MISSALGATEAQGNDAKRVSGDKGIIQSAYKKRKKQSWQQKSSLLPSQMILESPCFVDFDVRGRGFPGPSLAAAQ